MSHTVSGQTTSYTWDVAAPLPVVLKDNTYTYVYGLDLISATDAGGNQNYYVHNGLGSVTNVVDYSGNEKAVYFYDAFGNSRFTNEVVANVWKYTGEPGRARLGSGTRTAGCTTCGRGTMIRPSGGSWGGTRWKAARSIRSLRTDMHML